MTLREFAARRRKEIFQQIKELRAELAQLKAIQVYSGAGLSSPSAVSQGSATGGLTFQEMIIEILCERPQGANAQEILSLIYDRFGKKIMRSSISPQLSRLKQNGILSLNGGIWSLTGFGQNLKKKPAEKNLQLEDLIDEEEAEAEGELPLEDTGNGQDKPNVFA